MHGGLSPCTMPGPPSHGAPCPDTLCPGVTASAPVAVHDRHQRSRTQRLGLTGLPVSGPGLEAARPHPACRHSTCSTTPVRGGCARQGVGAPSHTSTLFRACSHPCSAPWHRPPQHGTPCMSQPGPLSQPEFQMHPPPRRDALPPCDRTHASPRLHRPGRRPPVALHRLNFGEARPQLTRTPLGQTSEASSPG
jgi:hypothetical protein